MSNKSDLIEKIAEKGDFTKKNAQKALNACLDAIQENLANGENLRIAGFGTFKVSERKERKGRNPQTGEEMTIPASSTVKFNPGKSLKDQVQD